MRNQMLAVLAASVLAVGGTASAAHAAVGTSGDGQPATSASTSVVFGSWTRSGYTDWQTDPTTPADPDGQSGEDNAANTVQLGDREGRQVAGSTQTEDSGWVTGSPGEGWIQVEQRTVTDQPAYDESVLVKEAWDEVVAPAVDQWYHWNGSNQSTPPLAPPADGWSADNGSHEGLTHKDDYAPNAVFDASQKGGDNASWFYHAVRDAVVVHHDAEYQTVSHDAVTHEEYRFEKATQTPGHMEYRWSVYERTNTTGTPDEPPGTPTSPGAPTVEPTRAPEHHQPTGQQPTTVEAAPPHKHAHPAVVPTVIDAGL